MDKTAKYKKTSITLIVIIFILYTCIGLACPIIMRACMTIGMTSSPAAISTLVSGAALASIIVIFLPLTLVLRNFAKKSEIKALRILSRILSIVLLVNIAMGVLLFGLMLLVY